MNSTEYYIKARLFPTVISLIPFGVLFYFGLRFKLTGFFEFIDGFKWVGDIGIWVILIYLLSQINRFFSKVLFEDRIFKNQQYFPTTTFLLHSDNFFSRREKELIHVKIMNDFNVRLYTETEEAEDEHEARRVAVSAVSRIRNATRDSALLLQHNIEYGFIRNLIGGSILALTTSSFSIFYFLKFHPNKVAMIISLILAICFFFLLALAKTIIKKYSKDYAKMLFEQYQK
jgi:hypothetical protein